MIRIGPAGAPRWFDQRMDRLGEYLDHIVAHGAGSIEFVVHGGAPGEEAERVHLAQRHWSSAINAAHGRGLDIHLHSPLTPEYRLSRWQAERADLQERYQPIVNLLSDVERGQDRPPALVLHAASIPDGDPAAGEQLTSEFISWLQDAPGTCRGTARIAVELRLRADEGDSRFDRQLSSLGDFVADLGARQVGICWDIANYLGSGERIDALDPSVFEHINHVHLHDSHPEGRGFHAPLGSGRLAWPAALEQLVGVDWSGAITLEIRYRYATEQGEPWRVLAKSIERVHRVLKKE